MSISRDRETIKENLQKKGFNLKDGGDHWRFIYYSKDGKKTAVHTKISRGTKYKMLRDNLLAQMAKQCKLVKSDFKDLIDCPLSRDVYEKKLEEQSIAI
ncbi:MAG: hypothetical protein LBD46_07895 [Endomicrobium sp.]|jgi:hypothetical protein|nr:hypothetical protein [Endomicrobium sp.]